MTTDRREALLERIRDETRQAVLEGDAQDCSSADCIADAVYEIVRAALAADPPALDVAFAEVEAALPEGWGIGIERSGFGYEVGAGKNEWAVWDGKGYPSLPDALHALAAHLVAREETLTVDRSRPCLLDPQCCRYQGHDGKHLYPDTP